MMGMETGKNECERYYKVRMEKILTPFMDLNPCY